MAKIICSDQDFVVAWQGSENVQEVADKTGLSNNTCQTRAAKLRKALENAKLPTLKKMSKGRVKGQQDLAALAALISPPVEVTEAETEVEAS